MPGIRCFRMFTSGSSTRATGKWDGGVARRSTITRITRTNAVAVTTVTRRSRNENRTGWRPSIGPRSIAARWTYRTWTRPSRTWTPRSKWPTIRTARMPGLTPPTTWYGFFFFNAFCLFRSAHSDAGPRVRRLHVRTLCFRSIRPASAFPSIFFENQTNGVRSPARFLCRTLLTGGHQRRWRWFGAKDDESDSGRSNGRVDFFGR